MISRQTQEAVDGFRPLTLAYSPCPNDTFIFHAVAARAVELDGFEFKVHLHDIDELNRLSQAHTYDITKLSFPAYLRVRDHYRLLEAGAALGHGCGPILVARPTGLPADRLPIIAVPGELTTANLLLNLWATREIACRQVRYHEVTDLVRSGAVDAGVLIHESRFTYAEAGLVAIVDLGAWWESETGLPVPLAGIAARCNLGEDLIASIELLVRRSIENARQNPGASRAYIRRHAQELDDETIARHIETFVTDFSVEIGDRGRQAIERLETLARERGLLP